ncbi:MAG: hypothetical protein K2X29_07910, partial [Candidatus Obscuribacterales bacterium]|nr:hypothetical protein [Candidatus Obscuribacterales bacterium]
MAEHDKLFKELLKSAFVEFLELFMPDVVKGIDRNCRIHFSDKEIFTDLTGGISLEPDLVAIAKYKGTKSMFIVHVEAQAKQESDFPRRMLYYYTWLHLKHRMPVYPIAICSYQTRKKQADSYESYYPDGSQILNFK